MNDRQTSISSGWTALKVIGMVIGVIGMVAFGACSLFGLTLVTTQPGGGVVFLFLIPGLLLTALFVWLILKIVRSVR